MKLRLFAAPFATLLTIASLGMLVHGEVPDVPTGQWLAGPALVQPRAGAVSVALDDGRVLVIGGRTADGPVNTVEVFGTDGSIALGLPMLAPRVGHGAVKLPDGRVYVTGGTTLATTQTDHGPVTTEVVTDSAEIFDPSVNAWYEAGSLAFARTGHTATALVDGHVVIAGGAGQDGAALDSFEVFDSTPDTLSSPGLLSAARVEHAAAPVGATRVLVAGGRNASGAVGTADLIDVATGTVSSIVLNTPRVDATATALLDGRILLAGGSDGSNDLESAEVVDPVAGASLPAAPMAQPRRGHQALLLPHNATVLITGGINADGVVSSAEQYVPWHGSFLPTAPPALPRTRAALAGSVEGVALLGGGTTSSGVATAQSELYGFATVKTDRDDYQPGTRVIITGSGWQPGTVTLVLHEVATGHADRTYSAVADASGSFQNTDFAPDTSHLGVRFYLTARSGGDEAQTTFTDAAGDNTTATISCASTTLTRNTPVICTVEVNNDEATPNNGWPQGAVLFQVATGSGTFAPSDTCTTTQIGTTARSRCSVSFTPTSTGTVKIKGNYNAASSLWKNDPTDQLTLTVSAPTDATPPSITPQVSGTLGNNNWYVSNVTVSWTVTDPDSAISSSTGCGSTTLSTDTAGTTYTCTATSTGGTTSQSVTIKRDATAPTASASPSPAANADGWNNTNVTVTFTGIDGLSGIDTCTSAALLTSEGAGQSASGTCTDKAGNVSASASATVNIDKTAPSALATALPAPNANGWNNTAVTVSFSGTDALSGIASCSAAVTLSSDGANQSASGTCTDKAGNVSASATKSVINIDTTAPTITLLSVTPPANGNGWHNSDVTVTWSCADSLSGVESSTVSQTLTNDGSNQSATGTCTDKGGNTKSDMQTGINIDTTAPTASASPSPAANADGWNNTNVTVTFTGIDGLSGIDTCTSAALLTSEGAGQSASGTCTDKAGNVSASASATVNIDKTAPSALATALPAPNANGWNNTAVTVSFSGTDALSGIASCSAAVTLSSDGANQSASGTCTDKAGNVSASATAEGINIDTAAPTITLLSVTPPANGNGWHNSDVTVTWSCADSLSGVESSTVSQTLTNDGSNQSATGTCTDKGGNTKSDMQTGINIDTTAPTASASPSPAANADGWNNTNVTVTFTGIDGLSGIDTCTSAALLTSEGAGQSASGTCTDKAGNVSASASATVNIDKTAPSALATALPAPNANGWNNTAVTVSFSGTDALSGIASCSAAVTLSSDGANQSASGTCTDKAGNVSASATKSGINIDKTAPSLSPTAVPNPVLLNGSATVSPGAIDPLSGIAGQSCGALDTSSVGSKTVDCTATDKAGNSVSASLNYSVSYATGTMCVGDAGHQILQPIDADGSSVFKKGSTVPAKFRVCDANGRSVGTAGVVTSFRLIQTLNGTVNNVDEAVISTTPDVAFRWSSTDQQWIFNMNTKSLSAPTTYGYEIKLNDGSSILYQFGLR